MASTSSASIPHTYDVFLSFRGEGTRYSFTDHLYEALCKAGIPLSEMTMKSKKLVSEELWLILEQKRTAAHFVLPVFYGVEPSDVRNQRGSFTMEAKEGDEASKWTQDNVKRWKAALREVAELKGMVVSGYATISLYK
ncbi:disease resistance protein RPV1-like [Bidens hawaiensis]|uniref:disease resistance protein RPV1-like n=1 Tax=Bidens hawaiensis TaxID=980011 RepID=UPI00404B2DFE